MTPWLSLLCPSCRPYDLNQWLESLYATCSDPKGIELSLTIEQPIGRHSARWGRVVITPVVRGQYNVNQLTEVCYRQSRCPYIFLSGDDTFCHTLYWDLSFKRVVMGYPDQVVLAYPDDTIFGPGLACYPVTSRLVMDHVPWPVPYERYCVDDTIFDIVPRSRRIYMPEVVMEHLHLVDHPPGHPVVQNGVTRYYPHEVAAMARDRALYTSLQPERDTIRGRLEALMR